MAPPLGEPGTGCHDNRGRFEGSWEWGYGGWGGVVELPKLGTTPWGSSFIVPQQSSVFLEIFQAHTRHLLTVKPPCPAAPALVPYWPLP